LGAKPEYSPLKRGFDEFYGTLGNTPYFHPTKFVDSRVSPDVQEVSDDNFYTTEKYSDRAVDWLGQQKPDRPWFLYVPFNAQHGPLQAPQKYLDRFPNIGDKQRQTFAAVMSAMDDTVGRVLAKVREMGQEEDTLIFFFSDNGGPTPSTTSSNGPLRGFKATTWEGGVRIPFCAQWKGQLPAGKSYENPIIQLDLLPTCITAAGGTVDSSWQLDGVNLLPYLKGENTARPHETLYWRFGEQWAVRHGDWKLVVGRGEKQPGLFNLAKDLAEAKDLSADQPQKVQELNSLWQSWNAEQAPPSSPKEAGRAMQKNKRAAKRKPASA
jgi:arylsulfatase A-like enzyme